MSEEAFALFIEANARAEEEPEEEPEDADEPEEDEEPEGAEAALHINDNDVHNNDDADLVKAALKNL